VKKFPCLRKEKRLPTIKYARYNGNGVVRNLSSLKGQDGENVLFSPAARGFEEGQGRGKPEECKTGIEGEKRVKKDLMKEKAVERDNLSLQGGNEATRRSNISEKGFLHHS